MKKLILLMLTALLFATNSQATYDDIYNLKVSCALQHIHESQIVPTYLIHNSLEKKFDEEFQIDVLKDMNDQITNLLIIGTNPLVSDYKQRDINDENNDIELSTYSHIRISLHKDYRGATLEINYYSDELILVNFSEIKQSKFVDTDEPFLAIELDKDINLLCSIVRT